MVHRGRRVDRSPLDEFGTMGALLSPVSLWFQRRLGFGPWFRRLLAAGNIAAVLLLTILTVSPEAHERLHADAGAADHDCAVTLYEHGLTGGLDILVVMAPAAKPCAGVHLQNSVLFLARRRRLLPPECGPPC